MTDCGTKSTELFVVEMFPNQNCDIRFHVPFFLCFIFLLVLSPIIICSSSFVKFLFIFLFRCLVICSVISSAGGMNGSIVYELDRPENIGLKKSLKACSMINLLFFMHIICVHICIQPSQYFSFLMFQSSKIT